MEAEAFQEKRVRLLSLVDIFKMMDGAKSHKLHHLLDVISEKTAPDSLLAPAIRITCSCHGFKSVSPLGFLLLEEVEGSVDSALQEIVSINFPQAVLSFLQEPLLSALASRASRQQKELERVEGGWVRITSKESARALLTLVQKTHAADHVPGYTPKRPEGAAWYLLGIWMTDTSGKIEADGWAIIASALALIPRRVYSMIASKELIREGTTEDMRTVWESLNLRWHVGKDEDYQTFLKQDGERSWDALELLAGWTSSGRARTVGTRSGLLYKPAHL